ncbi:MAG: SPOR domain-containing protein [Myxococcota bacterium]
MDHAMRDLEQIQEYEDGKRSGQRVTALVVSAGSVIGLVLAIGLLFGNESEFDQMEADPLGALSGREGLAPVDESPVDAPRIQPETLTFPEALIEDDRPEVAAALAAAAAEFAHPDPITRSSGHASSSGVDEPRLARPSVHFGSATHSASVSAAELGEPSLNGKNELDTINELSQTLPAADFASQKTLNLARAAGRDALVAGSTRPPQVNPAAPVGSEGIYTLQVISYRNPEEANAFAATLRSKGHQSFVVSAELPDRGMHWRVRIGPFERLREAEDYQRGFEDTERMNTFLIRRRD